MIFQYVVADIILYSKSLRSAETEKFWSRTSSECGTPAEISSCGLCPCLRLKNLDLRLLSYISATL
jgi:hypothetical protein